MKIRKIALGVLAAMSVFTVSAAQCDINLTAVPVYEGEDIPERVSDMLATRLITAAAVHGVVGGDNSRFFVTAKFNHSYKDINSGPPITTAIKTTMTVYLGDIIDKKVFATESFDMKGVGTSDERAYINAIKTLNGKNQKFAEFIEKGKLKIVDYYNTNYPQILEKAKKAMGLKSYEEALYWASMIPECCDGYAQAAQLTKEIYQKYLDEQGQMLFNKARGAWGASPDEDGAREAYSYLTQIDPQASCYRQSVEFGQMIAKQVKANWDFENITKYKDAVEMEKAYIKAARDVGVAYGNHQQPITYNVGWLW